MTPSTLSRITNPFSLPKEMSRVIQASFLIIVAGALWDIQADDLNGIGRAGALITMMAVHFAITDYQKLIDKLKQAATLQAKLRLGPNNRKTDELIENLKSIGLQLNEHQVQNLRENIESKLYNSRQTAINAINDEADKQAQKIRRFEAFILLSGTFIWGFGDLVDGNIPGF